MNFTPGTRVRHTRTGLIGTVIRDADNGTVPVLYDNGTRAAVYPADLTPVAAPTFTVGQSLTWGDEVVSFRRYLDGPWQGTHAEVFTSRGSRNVRVSELSVRPFKVGDQVAYLDGAGLARPGVIVTVVTDDATGEVEYYGVRYDGTDPRSRREVVFTTTHDRMFRRGA